MHQLIKSSYLQQLITSTAGAAGTSAINGASMDFANFEGALIIIFVGTLTATAVTSAKLQDGTTSSPTTDILGSNITITQATDSNTMKAYDVRKPVNRYMRLVISRGTANAVIGGAVAIFYGARSRPTVQQIVTDMIGAGSVNVLVSPAQGTP